MQTLEYARLAQLDRSHWFYRGKRAIARHWLERSITLGPDDLLIDAGTGTGTWIEEMRDTCRVLGLDDHAESLALAGPRAKAVGAMMARASLERLPLRSGIASAVTALDVLEHLRDDRAALRELVRVTRPGGIIVLTVPAMPSLWSDWDEALHHHRRYTRAGLRGLFEGLFEGLDVDVLRLAYFNATALLPIWLVRTWRRLRPPGPDAEWAEHRSPAPWLNAVLETALVKPARWGWFRPPFGVSLLAVLRKSNHPLPLRERDGPKGQGEGDAPPERARP